MKKSLKKIFLPERYNYIACFLTLECNLRCGYCINTFSGGGSFKNTVISGENWAEGLNRIVSARGLPVTIQGGEPGLHPDFISIISGIDRNIDIDILTNLTFNIGEFISRVDPGRLRRGAPYPNIRVSYHPGYMDSGSLIKRVLQMQKAGFSIGVFSVLHPDFKDDIVKIKERCLSLGIDFRTKEFLGEYKGKIYGSYLYKDAVRGNSLRKCLCRTSELIIGPSGDVYRCHHDLYRNFPPVGNILDPGLEIEDVFRECGTFGDCNPCDVKIKTDRFQAYGHTSVEIKF